MKILIVGGGKVGRNLAYLLSAQPQHRVVIIEKRDRMTAQLTKLLPNAAVIEGDGCDPAVLRDAGIEQMDAVAAVTGDDEDNLVIALLSKRAFRVGRVAARINNPKNAWLFTRRMGVDLPVDDAHRLARTLEADINLGAVVQMLQLREGKVTLVELTVAPTSSAIGRRVSSLGLPPDCVLAAIVRGETVILPAGDTEFQAGDQIIALARQEREAELAECFQ